MVSDSETGSGLRDDISQILRVSDQPLEQLEATAQALLSHSDGCVERASRAVPLPASAQQPALQSLSVWQDQLQRGPSGSSLSRWEHPSGKPSFAVLYLCLLHWPVVGHP